MKVAVCFYGNVGVSSSGDLDKKVKYYNPITCLNNCKSFFLKDYKPDFFVHCWNKDYKKIILDTLKPKDFIFEKYNKKFIKSSKNYKKGFDSTYKNYKNKKSLRYEYTASQYRWYSTSKVIDLMSRYSKTINVLYDFVIILRFDLFFYKQLTGLEKLDNSLFYTSSKNIIDNETLDDIFFISNTTNALKLSKLYENRHLYSVVPTYALKHHLDRFKVSYMPLKLFSRGKDFVIFRDIAYKYEHFLIRLYMLLIHIIKRFYKK